MHFQTFTKVNEFSYQCSSRCLHCLHWLSPVLPCHGFQPADCLSKSHSVVNRRPCCVSASTTGSIPSFGDLCSAFFARSHSSCQRSGSELFFLLNQVFSSRKNENLGKNVPWEKFQIFNIFLLRIKEFVMKQ